MTLDPYQRFAFRLFGRVAGKDAVRDRRLATALLKAGVPLRPEAYLATTYLNMVVALAVAIVPLVLVAALVGTGTIRTPTPVLVGLAALTVLVPLVVYVVASQMPESRGRARAKRIDAQMSYALSYMASLASAGVPPARIFTSLAGQKVFGEVAFEASFIARDLNALGKDLLGALEDARERTPSARFQDFLQGCVSALTSGVDVKDYFTAKSEQYFAENRQMQKQSMDNLGILAESFVTVVVAGPTFLIVLFSIMSNVGSSSGSGLLFGYLLVLVMLPLSQFGFSVAIASSMPEG